VNAVVQLYKYELVCGVGGEGGVKWCGKAIQISGAATTKERRPEVKRIGKNIFRGRARCCVMRMLRQENEGDNWMLVTILCNCGISIFRR